MAIHGHPWPMLVIFKPSEQQNPEKYRENDGKMMEEGLELLKDEPPICIHLLKRIGSSVKAEARCTHLWLGSISGAGSLMEVGFELAQLPSLSATQWEKYIQEHIRTYSMEQHGYQIVAYVALAFSVMRNSPRKTLWLVAASLPQSEGLRLLGVTCET